MENKIYVTKPFLPNIEEYEEMLKKIWDTSILTNSGPIHQEFVRALEEKFGTKVALFNNGHLALETVIKAMNFAPGSEVITTPFTFVSTTHAIVNNHLVPVFCDIKLSDYTIDEDKIESLITDKTVAIVPVHVYGHPCNVEAIQKIADKYHLKVIYDAAHAFGVQVGDQSLLSYGDASMVSFHATKVFHTIEGGMISSNNEELIKKLNILKNFGIVGPEEIEEVGINSKMNEFQSAMGLLNLQHFDDIVAGRKEKYIYYRNLLKEIEGIKMADLDFNTFQYNYAYLPILIEEQYGMTRNEIFDVLAEHNIFARKYFFPLIPDCDCYKGQFNDSNLKNASFVAERIMTLPFYNDLENSDIDRICKILEKRC